MKLYKITWDVITFPGEYEGAIVLANSKEEARRIHPDSRLRDGIKYNEESREFECDGVQYLSDSWTNNLELLLVEYLGEAEQGLTAQNNVVMVKTKQ